MAGFKDPNYGSELMRDDRVQERIAAVHDEIASALNARAIEEASKALILFGDVLDIAGAAVRENRDPEFAVTVGRMLGGQHALSAVFRPETAPDDDDQDDTEIYVPALLNVIRDVLQGFPDAAAAVATAVADYVAEHPEDADLL